MAEILYSSYNLQRTFPSQLDDFIGFIAINKNLQKVNLIVPTGKLTRHLEYKITSEIVQKSSKSIRNLNVLTLKSFFEKILISIIHTNYKIISDNYKYALFIDSLASTNLKFYSNNSKSISNNLASKLANVCFALLEDGFNADALRKELTEENSISKIRVKDRIEDIANIIETYTNELNAGEIQYFDYPKIQHYIQNNLNNIDIEALNKEFEFNLLLGFSEFSALEIRTLSTLQSLGLNISINLDIDSSNSPIFGTLHQSSQQLQDAGFIRKSDFSIENLESKSSKIAKYLFSKSKIEEKINLKNHLQIFAFNNINEEAKQIVKYIKYLLLEKKYQSNDICIALRKPEKYINLLRNYFEHNNILTNISDRFELSSSNIVSSIISVLEVKSYGFRYEDIKRLLELSYIQFNNNIDKANLLIVMKKLKITGGTKRGALAIWNKRFESYIRQKLNIIISYQDEDENTLHLEVELEQAQKAFDDFKVITRLISNFPDVLTASEFEILISKGILIEFGIQRNLETKIERLENEKHTFDNYRKIKQTQELEKETRALASFMNNLREMTFILSDRKGNASLPFSYCVEFLKSTIQNAKYQIRELKGLGVTITSIEQTRGIPYKVMILCGANEGNFPLPYRTNSFLGRELNDSEEKHQRGEKMQFYQFLTNHNELLDADSAEKQIVISYYKYEEDYELVPSPFIAELLEITENGDALQFDFTYESVQAEFTWYNAISTQSEQMFYYFKYQNNEFLPKPRNYDVLKDLKSSKIAQSNSVTIDISSDLFKNKVFSASQLNEYKTCPYKYYANRILNLPEDEDFTLNFSALEIGNILHKIAQNFYTHLLNEGINVIKINNHKCVSLDLGREIEYLEIIKNISEEVIKDMAYEHPFFDIDKMKLIGSADFPSLIKNWLHSELERVQEQSGFYPAFFELSIDQNVITPYTDNKDILVKGRIDRIDLSYDEQNKKYRLVLIDYKKSKSTSIPSQSEVQKGLAFQMPIYYVLAKKHFAKLMNIEENDIEIDSAIYYYFEAKFDNRSKKFIKRTVALYDGSTRFVVLQDKDKESVTDEVYNKNNTIPMYEIVAMTSNRISEYHSNMKKGYFNISPFKIQNCQYCSYSSLCRKAEVL